jgi:ABC-type branched-subunit amino acid transport system substrate-binding protein
MTTRSSTARFVLSAALIAGVSACGGEDGKQATTGGGGGGDTTPIVVGLLPPSAGPLAKIGGDAVKAWQFAAAEVNAKDGVDGHKVEIKVVQTDGQPATTVRAARTASIRQGAKFLAGAITSGENAALAGQLGALGAVNIVTMAKDDSLTGSDCSANTFRPTISSAMDVPATASILPDVPAKKWAIAMGESLVGHTAAKLFAAQVKANGGQVVSEQFWPLGTTEYGSYISKIKSSGADGLYIYATGADGVAFINQAEQFKLFDQVKTRVGFSTVSEGTFPALGDKALGWYNNVTYSAAFDNAKNKAFVTAWDAKEGEKPYFIHAENYIGAQFLFEAVRKAGSVDPNKVKAAMAGLSLDTVSGAITIKAADHQAIRDTFVGEVVKEGDGMAFKVIKTVPPTDATRKPDPACKGLG